MKQRSEEDILSKTPIKALLGSTEYDLKPLPIIKARAWRSKLAETMQSIVGNMDSTADKTAQAITSALVAFPDKVADLVFAWSPELPQKQILEEATEEQLAIAFSALMVMAYPFLAQLAMTVQVTKSQLK